MSTQRISGIEAVCASFALQFLGCHWVCKQIQRFLNEPEELPGKPTDIKHWQVMFAMSAPALLVNLVLYFTGITFLLSRGIYVVCNSKSTPKNS